MRKRLSKYIALVSVLMLLIAACNVLSTPEPTPTATPTVTTSPTSTSTPSPTLTPTATIVPSSTPIPPSPTPTPIEDVEAFKVLVVRQVRDLLRDNFAVLEIEKVEIVENTLAIEIVTAYGSVSFNGETAYYLSFDLANLLINEIGEQALLVITDGEGLSISYKSLSIHYDLEFRYLADFAALLRLSSEEISIPDWIELTDGRFL